MQMKTCGAKLNPDIWKGSQPLPWPTAGLASVVFDKALRTPAGTVKAEQTKEAPQLQKNGIDSWRSKLSFRVLDHRVICSVESFILIHFGGQ